MLWLEWRRPWEICAMDSFLDSLFDGFKSLEGRVVPKGASAALAVGCVLGIAVLATVLAFAAFSN